MIRICGKQEFPSHIDVVKQLINQDMVDGLDLTSDSSFPAICEACIYGKQHRDSFPKKASTRAPQILWLVHSDIHGPLKVVTPWGFKYWVTFIDDKSHFVCIYLMKTKDQALGTFRQYKALVENQTRQTIKILWDDKGGKYTSREFDALTASSSIFRQRTAPVGLYRNVKNIWLGSSSRNNKSKEVKLNIYLHFL